MSNIAKARKRADERAAAGAKRWKERQAGKVQVHENPDLFTWPATREGAHLVQLISDADGVRKGAARGRTEEQLASSAVEKITEVLAREQAILNAPAEQEARLSDATKAANEAIVAHFKKNVKPADPKPVTDKDGA